MPLPYSDLRYLSKSVYLLSEASFFIEVMVAGTASFCSS
jgi:hypothetical protein